MTTYCCFILNILALGLMVSMKEIFEVCFPLCLWELMSPGGVADLVPSGMVGMIFEVDHLRLLNTKYLSSGPHGFGEEDFF